jgi:hypothetical protein
MRFSDRVWKHQVLPLIDESFAKHIEIAAQLCKVGDEVVLGKKFYGTTGVVGMPLEELMKCEKGEWVGALHVEPLPHFPPFPSDVDIKQDFDWIRQQLITKPYVECVCSAEMEPAPIPKVPEKGKIVLGCYCEEWHPWTKEQHEEIVKRAERYLPFLGAGVGYWELWEDLKDLGFVRNPQLQYTEIYFKDYGKTWERVETKHEVHPIRIIEEEEHGKAG